jgi:hypothetical protein
LHVPFQEHPMSTPLPHPVEPAYSEAAAPLAVALVHRAIRLAHDTAPATPAAIAARDQAQAAIAELPPGLGRELLGLTCDVLDALGRYHDARAIAHAIMELRTALATAANSP